MPISKERRGELIAEYTEWFKQSQAVVIAGYQGVSTKDLYRLRTKIHEVQGELHVADALIHLNPRPVETGRIGGTAALVRGFQGRE